MRASPKLSLLSAALFCTFAASPASSALPNAFDARDFGIVSAVDDQGLYPVCWSFSFFDAYEANWRKQFLDAGLKAPEINFSERYLVWLTAAVPTQEEKQHTPYAILPDGGPHEEWISDDLWETYAHPGNFVFATSTALQSGIVNEVPGTQTAYNPGYPYNDPSEMGPIEKYEKKAGDIHDVFYFYRTPDNRQEFINNIKKLIVDNGISSIHVNGCAEIDQWIPDSSELCTDSTATNHIVTLVGWDDDYVFESLTDENGNPRKGAFILQNTWGEGYGKDGYYYLSYDSADFDFANSTRAELDAGRYTTLQTNSPLMYNAQYHPQRSEVLTASAYRSNANQMLRAVTFWSPETSTRYEITIRAAERPGEGRVLYTQSGEFGKDGSLAYPGIRTVDLNEFVFLPEGEPYTVEIKTIASEEEQFVSFTHTTLWSTTPVAAAPSWVFENGRWVDMATLSGDPTAVIEMYARGKNSDEPMGMDFTVTSLNDNGLGGSTIDLGKKDENYQTDALHPDRKTLSNMTVNLESGRTDSIYGGTITGEGSLTKTGTGFLILTGSSDYSGSTRVEAGELSVEGSLENTSSVVVEEKGTLSGSGTIKSNVSNSGTVRPGQHAAASLLDLINEETSAASMAKSSAKSAPYRLLTIDGAYSQSAQGTLEISFAQDGSHGMLKANSIKELEGLIVFTPEAAGFWTSDSSFEISNFLLAGDAAVGEENLSAVAFAGNAKSPSLTAGVESQKGAALVTIHRKQNAYSQYADDKGAASLGKALAAISEVLPSQGEEDFKGLFSALDWSDIEGRDIAQALHSLGPENYDEAARMSLRQQSELNAMLVHRQLLEAPAGSALRASDGKSIWAAPYGSVSRQDAHDSFDSAKSYGYGLMAGINAHIGNGLTTGVHFALASRDTRLSGPSGAQAETDSIYLGLHAKYAPDSWLGGYLLGQLSVGYEDGKMTRRIRAADYARTARSDWHGLTGSVLAGGGWDWTFAAENSSIHLGPVGWLEHMFLKRSSLTEDNAGAASLRVENETYNALSLALGAHAGFKHKMLDGSAFAADVLAAYKHDLTDGDFETKAAFRKFDSAGFASDSETTGRDALLIEAGFGLEQSKGLNAKLSFGSELFRNGYYSANFNFNLSWRY